MYTIRFDIQLDKRQKVAAYVPPLEVFATRIRIQREKIWIPLWARLCHRNKELSVFKNTNALGHGTNEW